MNAIVANTHKPTMNAIVADTPERIALFRLITLKGAVKLESIGMKRRGTSATQIARKELGLKARATHAEVIAALQSRIDAAVAE